jgi:hypothetical protein
MFANLMGLFVGYFLREFVNYMGRDDVIDHKLEENKYKVVIGNFDVNNTPCFLMN